MDGGQGLCGLYPNPRGSTTYGQEFGNVIQYHYPGDDYKDLMAGVDELIKLGYIDDKKLGVTGGSGGGLLTNWVVGQTNRFAAAVAQRDIASWEDWWYTGDFTLFQPTGSKGRHSKIPGVPNAFTDQFHQECDDADDVYSWRSGLPDATGRRRRTNVSGAEIPQDSRCNGSIPNESHELSRSGQPWHRVERLQILSVGSITG